MPLYEGIVTGLKQGGKAEVALGPPAPCIPHAPEASRLVCHALTEGSSLVIEALNKASAEVGDMVSVNRNTAALAKNALHLLGIPLLGLALGITAALLINHGSPHHMKLFAGIAALVIFLVAGLFSGIRAFRHAGGGGSPVIESILQRAKELEAALGTRKLTDRAGHACQTCHGLTPEDQ